MQYLWDVLEVYYTNDAAAFAATILVGPPPEENPTESQKHTEPYTYSLEDPFGYSPGIRQIVTQKNMEIKTPSDWNTSIMWFPNTPMKPTAINNNGVGLAVPLLGIDLDIPLPGGTVDVLVNMTNMASAKSKTPNTLQANLNVERRGRFCLRSARVTDVPTQNQYRVRGILNLSQVSEDSNLDQIIVFTIPKTLKNNLGAWVRLAFSKQT